MHQRKLKVQLTACDPLNKQEAAPPFIWGPVAWDRAADGVLGTHVASGDAAGW